MRRILFTLALTVAVAAPAGAQQLKMAFNQGLVSIDATSVPVRTVLAEWSKLGGTKVVGGERVAGAPLTLKLENVPEAQALEVVLRNVAGYMAAPRTATAGASMYDRILVLATSSAPPPAAGRPAAPNAAAQRPTAGTQRAIPPRFQPPQPTEDEEPAEEEDALRRKVEAVSVAIASDPELRELLDLTEDRVPTRHHGWIADTSIECDHQRFAGFLRSQSKNC